MWEGSISEVSFILSFEEVLVWWWLEFCLKSDWHGGVKGIRG